MTQLKQAKKIEKQQMVTASLHRSDYKWRAHVLIWRANVPLFWTDCPLDQQISPGLLQLFSSDLA
jgi:hypothetical protein